MYAPPAKSPQAAEEPAPVSISPSSKAGRALASRLVVTSPEVRDDTDDRLGLGRLCKPPPATVLRLAADWTLLLLLLLLPP